MQTIHDKTYKKLIPQLLEFITNSLARNSNEYNRRFTNSFLRFAIPFNIIGLILIIASLMGGWGILVQSSVENKKQAMIENASSPEETDEIRKDEGPRILEDTADDTAPLWSIINYIFPVFPIYGLIVGIRFLIAAIQQRLYSPFLSFSGKKIINSPLP